MNTIVIEGGNDMAVEVYEKLLNNRILFLSGDIADQTASDFCASLILKSSESPSDKITIFINSESCSLRSAFMIYDVMRSITCPIETICFGAALDPISLILFAGTPGLRSASTNALISIGPYTYQGGMYGPMTNVETYFHQMENDNQKLLEAYAYHTGKTLKFIKKNFDKKIYLNSEQAKELLAIDNIIIPTSKKKS